MRIWKPMAQILILLMLLLAFQNCDFTLSSNFLSQASLSNKSGQEMEGGATPYDGKPFILADNICPDGLSIESRIIISDSSNAILVRDNCQDLMPPVKLGANDFQVDPTNPNNIYFRSQLFAAEKPIHNLEAKWVGGFGYWLWQDFGTPANTRTLTKQSRLRIFENGIELGPPDSQNTDIMNLGQGRFNHWDGGQGQALFFSASDNSNPVSNGRVYTYIVGKITAANEIDPSLVAKEGSYGTTGFAYFIEKDFGTPADTFPDLSESKLQIYEDGKPLGPAHTDPALVHQLGQGRFCYLQTSKHLRLYFSSSDNTDPRINGRTYTWEVLPASAP